MSGICHCRICKSTDLVDVIDLGIQGLASLFPRSKETNIPHAPLVLTMCKDCGLVQLKHTIAQNEMYQTMAYGYRSGINTTMREHLRGLVQEAVGFLRRHTGSELKANDVVLDIGSNDCTLLKAYENNQGITRVGIDPTGAQFRDCYPEDVILVSNYFSADAFGDCGAPRAPRIITSISMFYDLPDPQQFMIDVATIMADDGIWIMEQSYLPTMLERQSFDTICHEHIEYYGLSQISYMAERAGLNVVRVSFNDCNGGSFRVILSRHKPSPEDAIMISHIIHKEVYLRDVTTYKTFMDRCDTAKTRLLTLLTSLRAQGKTIYLYGASTKGNTLLQYYGVNHELIVAAAERNPEKHGAFTPVTHIPIVSEDDVRNAKPDYMLVLPWHFKDEFLLREQAYLKSGGSFIFPLPDVQVVSYDNAPDATNM